MSTLTLGGWVRRASPAVRATRDILPLALSVVPFGAVVGVALDKAGDAGIGALVATVLLYAGSAQLATLSVLAAGGGVLGAVLAGAIVNARLLLYSAAHGHRFRTGQPTWFRWVGPLTTVDQTFALASAAPDLVGRAFRRYWGVMGTVLGTVWITAVVLGTRLGDVLAGPSPLDMAAPATLVALLVPHLGDPRLRRVAAVAGVTALVGAGLPSGLGLAAAVLAGLVVAGRVTGEVAR